MQAAYVSGLRAAEEVRNFLAAGTARDPTHRQTTLSHEESGATGRILGGTTGFDF